MECGEMNGRGGGGGSMDWDGIHGVGSVGLRWDEWMGWNLWDGVR